MKSVFRMQEKKVLIHWFEVFVVNGGNYVGDFIVWQVMK